MDHETRELLGNILGLLEIMKKDIKVIKQDIHIMKENSISSTVRDQLKMSRLK